MQFTLTLLNYPFNQDFIWISTNKCNSNVFSSIRTYCYSKEDLPECVIYPVKPVIITSRIVSSNPVHGEVYSIQHYVIKFVSDLRQFGGVLLVLRFPASIKKWSPRYNWNIFESGVKHHKPIQTMPSSLRKYFVHRIVKSNQLISHWTQY
jgi:hypothetical protein